MADKQTKIKFSTNLGDFIVQLNTEKAPITSNNFVTYVEDGFYEGTLFHRVIPGFMAQGGGFDSVFNKKKGHSPIINEASNGLENDRGTIAMARTPDPNSATSQFFINFIDNDFLNYTSSTDTGWGYAVFGEIIEGLDVVDMMSEVVTISRSGYQDVPEKDIVVEKAQVFYEHMFLGTIGNDILHGFTDGYYSIDGGSGIDVINYQIRSNLVLFSLNSDLELVIQNSVGQSETLVNIERIQFNDKVYALDLDGNAVISAKAIIATFGSNALTSYMSPALSIIDGGMTLNEVCHLVVDYQLIENIIGSNSNGLFVDHVYKNVVGVAPSQADHDMFTVLLDNGTHTKSSLLALAAETTLTEDIMKANLVDLIGVPGSEDGEMLAIQYDLG